MRVDRPRVIYPLALLGLGSGFGLFSSSFLLSHTHKSNVYSYPKKGKNLLESGRGSRAVTCFIHKYLPFNFNTQFSPSRNSSDAHYSLKEEMATLSPATMPTC